ncbi:conserved hypothetical protein [Culex quinquefasciatus]|uniref:Myb/SANT-like DNA-binding domain-containing protein n=1 Tax=Culex quinquefasciatus TaxID=7176 RepID=B0XAE2_CULQU|nr:conserved hypothetical protein [Culex quinquefasciatus]|eukprot:XP_001866614.1 conserved hypothetical protein [Culex quinquefasciatus]
MTSSWSTEETNLLIRKRLEMFGCARSDKVYDQISLWLAEEHNFYKNAAACQTRFNNVLKTYRSCVKRVNSGGFLCKIRFPFFDIFHEYYSKQQEGGGGVESSASSGESPAGSKCKSEIFLEDMFEDSSYGGGGGLGDPTGPSVESMLMDSMHTDVDFHSGDSPQDRGDDELTTSLTATNGGTVEDLKLRLMEQKLLYYTNQNMLLQMKQVHYRQKEQDRARGQLMAEEILRVLKGIHSCLKKTSELRVTQKDPESKPLPVQIPEEPDRKPDLKEQDEQLEEEEAEEEELEEPEAGGLHLYVESDEDDDVVVEENGMDVQQPPSSPERTAKKEVGRLKVRKNIFPPWNRIQTVLLIKIHCDLRPKFKGYNLFECVSNKLIELHINRTPRDCRTRWNNLFRTYKDCRSRLRVNEKAAVKFEYFDEIDAYFKDKEFVAL